MPSIRKNFVLISFCAISVIPAANAKSVTLAGEGVAISYEDKADELLGAPSLIATSLMAGPVSFSGGQGAAAEAGEGLAALGGAQERQGFSVSALGEEQLPRSFAERAALSFSLSEAGGRNSGFYSLLLAGLGLFGLIARQRMAVLSRCPNSPGFL